MGEVWKARDTRLRRDVAIKTLPGTLADDPARLARLEREAELLAALNHPHIATIHGLERVDGASFLVLELVEGDTLEDRIRRGAIPPREALSLAQQIAQALEAAHDKGIIHRDLKPANIKITRDRRIKVLDFGLAKAVGVADADETIAGATQPGIVLGTPAYMSPEQARGEPAGVQSDIWSFGVVLYEMLTVASPFKRKTGAETLARVLEWQPDYGALPADTPALATRLIRRCLERDPSRRLQHMGDVRILLDEALASDAAHDTGPISAARRRGPWIAAGLLAAILAGLTLATLPRRSTPARTMSPLYVSLPFDGRPATSTFTTRHIAITRDGSTVAFASNRGLQIRHINQRAGVVIAAGGHNPFFSPDGEWVGLFAGDTAMVKVPVRGGAPVTITTLTDRPFGASWRADGTIVFATTEGLFAVPENGGVPTAIARPERSRGETLFAWPHVLPDGRSILYTAVSTNTNEGAQTILLDLKSHQRKPLVQGSSAVYARSGHLVYSVGATLNAIGFDAATGALTAKPTPIPDISVAASAVNGAAEFALSDTGNLVFLAPAAPARSTLEWIDRRGQHEPLDVEPQNYGYAMVSPDGTRVAVERTTNGKRNIWILDLRRMTQTQLTDGPTEDMVPLWSVDSQRIFFASNRSGNFDVYSQPADGASSATLVFGAPEFQAPSATTPDGNRLLIYDRFNDLAVLNLAKPDRLDPVLHSGFDERLGQISRDGRWIAYESNESGNQFEIVVRSFPDVGARREIVSINGGRYPRWGPKGFDELYYLSGEGAMMAVPITFSPTLGIGTPKKLFDWQKPVQARSGLRYDVAPDGRFLMTKPVASSADVSTNISLILNWVGVLRTREP